MIRNFDVLIWTAHYGHYYLFGVLRDDHGAIEFTGGLIEYDGKEGLYATVEPCFSPSKTKEGETGGC